VVSPVVFFLLHGKGYYLAPIYPVLFATGAVMIEAFLDQRKPARWLKPAILTVVVATGLYFAPIVVPVFSPEIFLTYTTYLPMKLPVTDSHARAALPQWYSDQIGFKEIADAAISAWSRIPPEERSDCGIFAQDYGQAAGAIDFFGRKLGFPRALSGDRTYYLWGPGGYSGKMHDCPR